MVIKAGAKSIRIYMCCDDSHKTAHEEDNKIYVYENEGNNRVEIKNWE